MAIVVVLLAPRQADGQSGWRFVPPRTDAPAGPWLKKNGWKEQRGNWDSWRFVGGALKTSQSGDSTLVGRKLRPGEAKGARMLRATFTVMRHPRGADLRKKGTEDSGLRIFVVFGRGGGLFSPPDSIAYAFGAPSRKGRFITSDRFDNVKYIVVAGGKAAIGKRITLVRDVVKDYRKAFGRAAPPVRAIGIKSDSNNVGGQASALVHSIELTP